jgi:hypothetical protein
VPFSIPPKRVAPAQESRLQPSSPTMFRAHRRARAPQGEDLQAIAATPYEIAQAIWGNVAVTQAFLTLSEVIGHANLLVNEERAREVDEGEIIRYEAVE